MVTSAAPSSTLIFEERPTDWIGLSLSDRGRVRLLAKEVARVENWLSYKWVGWPVILIGAYLIIEVILMTQANINRTVIFNVLLPGTTIGLGLMLVGRYFVHLSDKAQREQKLLKSSLNHGSLSSWLR